MAEKIFTNSDLHTPTADRMREHLKARIAKLQSDNDNERLDATDTAVLRGRIAEAKNFLALLKRPEDR